MKLEYTEKLKELYKYSDIDLLRYFKQNPNTLAFFPLAKRLYMKNKFVEAVQILLLGLKNYRDLTEASILLSKAYLKLDLEVDAVKTLKSVINSNPNNASAYYYLSTILYKQELTEKAEVVLLKAYELDPHDPDIKNSFHSHFNGSFSETLEVSINIAHTVAESLHDIKKRSEHKVNQVLSNPLSKISLFDELEKEFNYNSSKKWYYIGTIVLIVAVAVLVLSLTFNMTEKDKTDQYKKQMIELLNTDLSMKTINQVINSNSLDKFTDIITFYQTLYYYQKDNTKFLNTIDEVKNKKELITVYDYLSKMTYYLYEGKDQKFEELYDKVIKNKKYSRNPDIFMLKAHQLIANKDFLNAISVLSTAYDKANKTERFKVELAIIYLHQRNFSKIKELFVGTIPISNEGDMFLELSKVNRDTERIKIIEKYIEKIPQRLVKRKLTLLLAKLYLDNKNIEKSKEILKNLPKSDIKFYIKIRKVFN